MKRGKGSFYSESTDAFIIHIFKEMNQIIFLDLNFERICNILKQFGELEVMELGFQSCFKKSIIYLDEISGSSTNDSRNNSPRKVVRKRGRSEGGAPRGNPRQQNGTPRAPSPKRPKIVNGEDSVEPGT